MIRAKKKQSNHQAFFLPSAARSSPTFSPFGTTSHLTHLMEERDRRRMSSARTIMHTVYTVALPRARCDRDWLCRCAALDLHTSSCSNIFSTIDIDTALQTARSTPTADTTYYRDSNYCINTYCYYYHTTINTATTTAVSRLTQVPPGCLRTENAHHASGRCRTIVHTRNEWM